MMKARKLLSALSWISAALMWVACVATLIDKFPGGWAAGVICQIIFGILSISLATFLE